MVSHRPQSTVVDSRPVRVLQITDTSLGAGDEGSNPSLLLAVLNRTDTSFVNCWFNSNPPFGAARVLVNSLSRSSPLPASCQCRVNGKLTNMVPSLVLQNWSRGAISRSAELELEYRGSTPLPGMTVLKKRATSLIMKSCRFESGCALCGAYSLIGKTLISPRYLPVFPSLAS